MGHSKQGTWADIGGISAHMFCNSHSLVGYKDIIINGYAMDTVCPEVDILCSEQHDGYHRDGLIIWSHLISTNESKELISGWRSPVLQAL